MKILLIQPNYREIYSYGGVKELTPLFPPLGLAYIAAVLKKNNFEVKILEANANNLTHEQIKQEILEYNPTYVGITATTCMIEEANEIAKLCLENTKVIVGGIHSSSLPVKTLEEFPDIDAVCIGEGEFVFLELAQGKELSEIKGIAYKKDASIITNQQRELIQDLDSLPLPARELLPMDKYYSAGSKTAKIDYILSSRGCPFNCIFCADHLVHGKRFRYRSPENVIAEIEFLANKGVEEFDFVDDNFTLLPERAHKICDLMIEKGLNQKIAWRCSNGVRIDRLDLDLLKKMKKAGCYMLALGIESGNDQILQNIKKGITKEKVREVVKLCKQAEIETRGLFMLGNLGENKKTMVDTINFAKELDLETATFHITIPFPKTEYWDIIKKEGNITAKNWKDYIAYGHVVFNHGEINPELLIKLQKQAYRSYYFRPKMVIKKLKQINSFSEFKNLTKKAVAAVKISFGK